MVPIIFSYRKLDPEIVKARREEFAARNPEEPGTKAHFLRSLQDPLLFMELYRRGFPLDKLRAMRERGSFGQRRGENKNPHIITVEHMTP